jgi:1-acyl-sn-glycerol-3-phosphate acyltransferase
MPGFFDTLGNHEFRAIAFLVAMVLLPAGRVAVTVGRSRYTVVQLFFRLVAKLLVRIQWRTTVPPFPLPPNQPVLLVCNHRSSVDPFFIQIVAPRPIHWMVAREYCEHWAMGWFLRMTEAIPTNRAGIDTAATKAAIRYAMQGEWVGMLPEGRINMTDELLLPGRPGAVVVALKARVPILPCYIDGAPYAATATSPFLMRAKVTVHFGELIDLSPYYDRTDEEGLAGELMLRVLAAIAALAGQPDFQPRLAGRRWRPNAAELSLRHASHRRRQGLID